MKMFIPDGPLMGPSGVSETTGIPVQSVSPFSQQSSENVEQPQPDVTPKEHVKEGPSSSVGASPSTSALQGACSATASLESALDSLVNQMGASSLDFDYTQRMVESIRSKDIKTRLEATQAYRRSLSTRQENANSTASSNVTGGSIIRLSDASENSLTSAPFDTGTGPLVEVSIEDIIQNDVVRHIVDSLRIRNLHLQLESVLLIQRLCGGSILQTQRVVTDELIDAIVNLLNTLSLADPGGVELRVAIFSLLTKLAIDFKSDKNLFHRKPTVVLAVLSCARSRPDVDAVRCVQALVHPSFLTPDMKRLVLDFIVRVMSESTDPTSLSLACNACVTLCDCPNGVAVVLNAKAIPHILKLLNHDDENVVFNALSISARIAFIGSTPQIDEVISLGAVSSMVQVLQNPSIASPMARARACNTIGNLGCETPTQVQAIIDTHALPLLVDIFQIDPDYNTRIEAAYAVCACLSRASASQVGLIVCCTTRAPSFLPRNAKAFHRILFTHDAEEPCVLSFTGMNPCLHLIADMLELVCESDPSNRGSLKLCKAILRGLENILEVGEQEGKLLGLDENPYARLFHVVQGDIKLARMRFFPDYNIASKTHWILQKYFSGTGGSRIWNLKS